MDTLGDDYILIPQDFGMIREVLSGRSLIEKGSKNNVLKRDTVSFGKTKARYVRIIGKNTPVLPKWHPGAGKRTYLFLDEITID